MIDRRRLAAGALVALLATGCSGDADPEVADPSDSASAPDSADDLDEPADSGDDTGVADDGDGAEVDPDGESDGESLPSSTTTEAPETDPEPDPEPDGEGFDVDREFSSDSEAENFGPIGSTETTIPTDEGEISIGGGEVPELGDDFPLPEGFEVQLSTEVEGEIGFSGRVDGEFADLVGFFEASLPSAGYEIVERQIVDGVLSVLTLDGPLAGDVVVSQEPGGSGWTILVALAEPVG